MTVLIQIKRWSRYTTCANLIPEISWWFLLLTCTLWATVILKYFSFEVIHVGRLLCHYRKHCRIQFLSMTFSNIVRCVSRCKEFQQIFVLSRDISNSAIAEKHRNIRLTIKWLVHFCNMDVLAKNSQTHKASCTERRHLSCMIVRHHDGRLRV